MRFARETFRSLRVRNFRLFLSGQVVSQTGTWMQTTAIAWLVVHDLHAGGTVLGLVIAAQYVPTLVGGPWAGVVADRFDKRRILLVTQSSMAVLAGLLAGVTLAHVVTLWMVAAISFGNGIAVMFDNPTRQAFVQEMVGDDDLLNAIGLNSSGFNIARVAGPALAGVLIVAAGTGVCFAFNAVSFLAVLWGLAAMRPHELFTPDPVPRAKGQIREGVRYALCVPELRVTLAMLALIGTFTMNFMVVLPLLAQGTFHGGVGTFTLLSVAFATGSAVGALAIATRAKPTARMLAVTALALGVFMLGAAAAPGLGWEYVLMGLSGVGAITFMATANTTLQLNSRSDMRGRVMSLYMVLFVGSTPIGAPIVGWIADHAGPRWSVVVGGAASLVAVAAVAFLRARLRPAMGRAPAPSVTAA